MIELVDHGRGCEWVGGATWAVRTYESSVACLSRWAPCVRDHGLGRDSSLEVRIGLRDYPACEPCSGPPRRYLGCFQPCRNSLDLDGQALDSVGERYLAPLHQVFLLTFELGDLAVLLVKLVGK